ncbi:MAG: GNAT family N-acetyltransferase [Bacillota bacterium]|nr:GNAT family N-acetyltransferase [Bacillota bacterium]
MKLRYLENPELKVKEVAALRKAVGWDSREDKIEKILGCTYLTAVCYDGKLLVGFVDVLSDEVDDALIRSLIVHPDYQRKGIGLRLLKMVTHRVKTDKIKTVNVLFEPELAHFYERAGFRIVGGGLIDNENEAEGF